MGKPTGFKKYIREIPEKRSVSERLKDYKELYLPFEEKTLKNQAGRCMDCGVPTCHAGCPLGNLIPDWNDLVYNEDWEEAIQRLHATNNFPEFTGRLCPAPCEEACVLGIIEPAVTIEEIEKQIIERAFNENRVKPNPPTQRTRKTVAVIGSGPAGLAATQQLNRAGHTVTLFERDDRIGGLLRYGIPDFKMEKWVIDRRLKIMEAEGIHFETSVDFGKNRDSKELQKFDAIVLAMGSTKSRELPIPGDDLEGIHMAMNFLTQQNRVVAGDALKTMDQIHAKDKHVIVIGGGDTGSDCIGTSNRQGAKSVTNFELFPQPSEDRPDYQPWPYWPLRLRTSTSHAEGVDRHWGILTKEFKGSNGKVEKLVTVDVEFLASENPTQPTMKEVQGSEKEWPADLVILALGFVGPESEGLITELGIELDERRNIKTDSKYTTNIPHIFSAGDCCRGQSLIVWAISEGRETAHAVDQYLTGTSNLPSKGNGDLPRIPFQV
ncbi:MAG: glutamate synthase small subunit [Kiritimatiellae bacterium]|nr:glutamate synthase small subunit [Kiritimatiellia bacterium]